MKKFYSKLFLFCAVLVCVFSTQAQSGYSSASNGESVLSIKSVTRTQIVYVVRVIEPEFPIDKLVKEYLSKSGILACVVNSAGDVEVTTESEIDKTMVIGVVKAGGFRKTYNTYKLELRAAIPVEKHLESR